ncbi:heterokaryon incompatibility protein-domain-containing protein [Hypoxylon crocopeplum]|nr:heterokaryon incompatibility protein-domain-containing protein [Hypoxylon crocopeplum]
MSLCDACKQFRLDRLSDSSEGRISYPLPDVRTAATAGCNFCNLLWSSLGYLSENNQARVLKAEADLCIHLEPHPEHWNYLRHFENIDGLGLLKLDTLIAPKLFTKDSEYEMTDGWPISPSGFEICLAADSGSAAAISQDIKGRYLGPDVYSDQHFLTIQKWLYGCLDHSACGTRWTGERIINPWEAVMPSRCIHITPKRCSLRSTDGIHGAYITLSHRWNDDTKLSITTTDNYEDRERGVWQPTLPSVFRDTLLVAGRLGIQYVWIDSLCIIQNGDGGADLGHEIMKMGQYYQNSLLNIASASNSHQYGLFHPVEPMRQPYNLVRLPYRQINGKRSGYFYAYQRSQTLEAELSEVLRNSQLSMRGWVFQERILTPRTLSFTQAGLTFECQTQMVKKDTEELWINPYAQILQNVKPQLDQSDRQKLDSIGDGWQYLLQWYTEMKLTKPEEDRVKALAGIAGEYRDMLQQFAPGCSSEYISGLWLWDIHQGLLWEHVRPLETLEILAMDITPSWSWASVLARVFWPSRDKAEKACTIVKLTSKGGDTYDVPENIEQAASEGSYHPSFDVDNLYTMLTVRGRIVPIFIGEYLGSQKGKTAAALTGDEHVKPDLWRAVCSLTSPELISGWGSFEQPDIQSRLVPPTKAIVVVALHIATVRNRASMGIQSSFWSTTHKVYRVLFLECVGGQRYRRVGVGRIFEPDLIAEFDEAPEQEIDLV